MRTSHPFVRTDAPLRAAALAGIAAAAMLAPLAQADTLIHAGRLIDTERGRVLDKVSIVVAGTRIIEVREGFADPKGYTAVHDLKAYTVMPGLMDMHVHITSEFSPTSYTERFYINPADSALRATVFMKRTIDAGFTTVRDLGASDGVAIALRNAVSKGYVVGPRIFAAGKSIATTGGHADPTNGLNNELRKDLGPADGVINGADDARKAVRARYKEGADLIKVTGTGGVGSLAKNGLNPQLTDEEFKAVIETAKDYDFAVAVHAHGKQGMLRAIKAGADSIEHGSEIDDEVVAAMKQYGTWYVPTISASKFVVEKAKIDGWLPEIVRPKAAAIGIMIQNAFARAYRGGVKIAFGTDSGVGPHGSNGAEFGYMVEAGMPAMAAIQSATLVAAQLLRQEKDLGSIKAGKLADIVAVKGDPLKDIALMKTVGFVMKDGVVLKQ